MSHVRMGTSCWDGRPQFWHEMVVNVQLALLWPTSDGEDSTSLRSTLSKAERGPVDECESWPFPTTVESKP